MQNYKTIVPMRSTLNGGFTAYDIHMVKFH